MNKLENVWVFSDATSRLAEVVAAGTALGEKVSVLVLGSATDISQAYALGASTVYHLGDKDDHKIVEDYAQTIAQTIEASGKPTLIILAATKRGKALASKLGVLLHAGVINDATDITIEADGVKAKHMVYGGLALGEEKIKSSIAIITIGNGIYEAAIADNTKTGSVTTVEFVIPQVQIKCIERRAKQGSTVDLGKAKRVVSIGRGIAKQEDIAIAQALCSAIGAEMGCSRPIAEGEKWMERERYIGVSGVMLKPDVYIALGISGQIQHMVGANSAQTIIAVNKDKNAPIFQYADYGIVGDLYKIVPALTAALKG